MAGEYERSFAFGNEYVNGLFDTQARKKAGSAVAAGDYQGASQALGARGDVEGAHRLRTFQDTQKNADVDRKLKMFQAQTDYMKRAVPIFAHIYKTAGPQAALQAFDQIAPELQQLGVPPETIAQYKQAFAQNPEQTLQMLGAATAKEYEFRPLGNGDIAVIDKTTGQLANTIKGEPKAPAPPSPADMARDANNPFRADGSANTAYQQYETNRARQIAEGNRQAIVNNPLPNQGGSGLTPRVLGVAKQKITGLHAIENQINRVEQAMGAAEKGGYTGYLMGNVPGGLDAESDTFDKAVAQLAPLIRQLTRVPGEGAMSDYESRLATLTLPSRRDTPEGRRESLEGLRELIREIRAGYDELLGQSSPQSAPAAAPRPQGGGGRVIDFNSLPD